MNFNTRKKIMNLKTGKIFSLTESSINHLKKTGQWKDMEIMPEMAVSQNVTIMPPAEKPARKKKAEETIEIKPETQTQTSNPETNETF
jgi:hypothetical protein